MVFFVVQLKFSILYASMTYLKNYIYILNMINHYDTILIWDAYLVIGWGPTMQNCHTINLFRLLFGILFVQTFLKLPPWKSRIFQQLIEHPLGPFSNQRVMELFSCPTVKKSYLIHLKRIELTILRLEIIINKVSCHISKWAIFSCSCGQENKFETCKYILLFTLPQDLQNVVGILLSISLWLCC